MAPSFCCRSGKIEIDLIPLPFGDPAANARGPIPFVASWSLVPKPCASGMVLSGIPANKAQWEALQARDALLLGLLLLLLYRLIDIDRYRYIYRYTGWSSPVFRPTRITLIVIVI